MRRVWLWSLWAFLLVAAVDCKWQVVRLRLEYFRDPQRLAKIPAMLASDPPRIPEVTFYDLKPEGFQAGDVILSVNGRPADHRDVLRDAIDLGRPGDVVTMTVRRGNAVVGPLRLTLRAEPPPDAAAVALFVLGVIVVPLIFLMVGFLVCARRIEDVRAWAVLLMLIGFSTFFESSTRQPVHGYIANGFQAFASSVWPVAMLIFALAFPERFRGSRRVFWAMRLLLWMAAVVQLVIVVGSVLDEIRFDLAAAVVAPLEVIAPLVTVLYIAIVGSFFFLMYYRSNDPGTSPDGRRRIRILRLGGAVGLTPLLLAILWQFAKLPTWPDWMFRTTWLMVAIFPLTLAYVIVVDRALELRIAVRAGVRYALARGGVVVLMMGMVGLLIYAPTAVFDQNKLNLPQKLTIIGGLVIAILLLRKLRAQAFEWLDRKFFREAYDTERILTELSQEVRDLHDPDDVLRTLAERIGHSLHVPRMAVLLANGDKLHVAHWHDNSPMPDVPADRFHTCLNEIGTTKSPLKIYLDDPRSWVNADGRVSPDERAVLLQLGSQLLVPLTGRRELLGVMSLGAKQSEEPYSRNDLRLLQTVANQAAMALENAQLTATIAAEAASRERLNRELEIARDVQNQLFPQRNVSVDGIEYFGYCRPAYGVGGDYYDFLHLSDGQFGIAIGDVAGKGIGAALTMASLQASLRAQTIEATNDLSRVISNMNKLLYEASASNRYATFFYAQYIPQLRRLVYVNAGHNPPFLVRRGQVTRLCAGGMVVGLMPGVAYEQTIVELEPGDVLLAYTDGISEAMNARDEEWGEENLQQVLVGCHAGPCPEIVQTVLRHADAFINGAPQSDDMTIVAVRF